MAELGRLLAVDQAPQGPNDETIDRFTRVPIASNNASAYHRAVLDALQHSYLPNPAIQASVANAEKALAYMEALGMETEGYRAKFAEATAQLPETVSLYDYVNFAIQNDPQFAATKESLGEDPVDIQEVAAHFSGLQQASGQDRMANFKRAKGHTDFANIAMQVAGSHSPEGPDAQDEWMTQSEYDKRPGSHGLLPTLGMGELKINTPNEAENANLQSKRIFDLFRASQPNYAPASLGSQMTRAVATAADYIPGGMMMGVPSAKTGRAMQDAMQIGGEEDGKLGYAARYYNKGRPDASGQMPNLQGPAGPNYVHADAAGVEGMVDRMYSNTNYPIANATAYMSPLRHIGDRTFGRTPLYSPSDAMVALRMQGRSKVVPDGVDKEQWKKLVGDADTAESKANSWVSAKKVDLMGGKYPSAAVENLLNIPQEFYSDPVNAGVNALQVAYPILGAPVMAMRLGIGPGLLQTAKSIGKKFIGDIGEESVESAPLAGAVKGAFTPQETVPMMGDVRADDPDYNQKYDEANDLRMGELARLGFDYNQILPDDHPDKKKKPVDVPIGGFPLLQ